jgi:hypothetical protein
MLYATAGIEFLALVGGVLSRPEKFAALYRDAATRNVGQNLKTLCAYLRLFAG